MSGQLLSKPSDLDRVRPALSGLEELVLATNRYLSDLTFNRLTSACPNLRWVSLAGNKILIYSEACYGAATTGRVKNLRYLPTTSYGSWKSSGARGTRPSPMSSMGSLRRR
jgi:hypothetical protein